MTDYVCNGKALCVSVRAHACVYIAVHCMRWDKGTAGEKKTPPYLIPHPTPPHVYASPNWILYYRSSQVWTTHFPLPVFAFSLFHFSFLHSCFIPFLSFFLPYPARVKVLPFLFCPSAKDLVEFVHDSVISAVVCLHRFSWGLIRLDVWLHT